MRVLVCDFPSEYRFPANGYGSTQRWLATVAKYASRIGHETIASGPLWDCSVLPGVRWWTPRLDGQTIRSFEREIGRVDVLVAGHEAFGCPEWETPYLSAAERCSSYQHGLELYPGRVYDGQRKRLFCFSEEMMQRFADQQPRKLPCYSEGIDEMHLRRKHEGYLVWIGRLDGEKAVHHAVDAARQLGRRLVVIGEPVRDREYARSIRGKLSESHVTLLGTQVGPRKMEVLARAACLIYTCAPDWIEAAAAVFWEAPLSGVPIAGMAWRPGTGVAEAIGGAIQGPAGVVARVDTDMGPSQVAAQLAMATDFALTLNRDAVQEFAREAFDPVKHVRGLVGT